MVARITTTKNEKGGPRYLISKPFDIGPRLWPSLKLSDGSRVSITIGGRGRDRRIAYLWAVDDPEGKELGSAADIHSGVGAEPDVEATFSTFASFVAAWVEAQMEGENGDLFPQKMAYWAEANSDELWMLAHKEGE